MTSNDAGECRMTAPPRHFLSRERDGSAGRLLASRGHDPTTHPEVPTHSKGAAMTRLSCLRRAKRPDQQSSRRQSRRRLDPRRPRRQRQRRLPAARGRRYRPPIRRQTTTASGSRGLMSTATAMSRTRILSGTTRTRCYSLYSNAAFACRNGGTATAELLVATYAAGNAGKKPAGSGFWVADLDKG